MLKKVYRLFVVSAALTFFLLMFFDVVFQTSGEVDIVKIYYTEAGTPFQKSAIEFLVFFALPVSVVGTIVMGIICLLIEPSVRQSPEQQK